MKKADITAIKKTFSVDKDYWSPIYRKASDDIDFLSDNAYAQWDTADALARTNSKRPALTIDQLGQFVHQVVNDIKINTPTINIIPSGKDGDEEIAEIYKGLIKNIEYSSSADDAYDNSVNDSVRSSIGFIRVDHDYIDEISFDQELLIKRVVNPLAVFLDSNSIELDGRDAMHCTILEQITADDFKEKYPKFDPICFENSEQDFHGNDHITIAEFFKVVEEKRTIGINKDGHIEDLKDGHDYANIRTIKRRTIKRYKLSGADLLEETVFPGSYIPLIPVFGEESWNKGKRNIFSLIRKSKEAQKMFNFWKSLETELIMKQPQAPVMAAEGQVEDYSEDWSDPNKAMVLRYKQTDLDGNPAPMPTRLPPPTIPTGVINASRSTIDDIKATMGMYSASLGARGNETSGVAINERKQEGEVATYHFGDNLVKSITHVGRVLVSAIPKIYDTERVLRIIGEEDEPKRIGINGATVDKQEESIDLSKGRYDVKVTAGASYTTRRQEAATFFSDIVTRQPDLMQVMGDLLFKNMDFTGASAMSERMKKLIDPKLLEENNEEDNQAQQQIEAIQQEAQATIQALQVEMQKLQENIDNKQADLQIKAQSEMTKSENDKASNELKILELQLKEKQFNFDAEIKMAELRIKEQELEIKELETEANIKLDTAKLVGTEEFDEASNMLGNEPAETSEKEEN